GEALFLFRRQAAGSRILQPTAETCLHDCDRAGSPFGAHRPSGVEADSIFLAGLDDGRISLCAHLALRGDVGNLAFCARASRDGALARLEQFLVDAYRLEERSRVLKDAPLLGGAALSAPRFESL